jgi:hypothetical protein
MKKANKSVSFHSQSVQKDISYDSKSHEDVIDEPDTVNFGILQQLRTYETHIKLGGAHQGPFFTDISMCHPDLKIDILNNSEQKNSARVTLHSREAGKFRGTFDILNEQTETTRTITVHATVMGVGKGTPSIRASVKCIGMDTEEEVTEWQGFDSECR